MMKIFALLLIYHVLAFTSAQDVTIILPPTGARVCQGGTITLRCRVRLNDVARDGTWLKNDVPINAANMTENHFIYFGAELTDLIITNVGLDDNNTVYSCEFSGVSNISVLQVEGPPTIRNFVSRNCSANASISWDPTSSSNPVCGEALYDVKVHVSLSGEVVMMIRNTSITSHNLIVLNNSVEYTVTINGSNGAGPGTDESFQFMTAGPPTPLSFLDLSDSEICVNDFTVRWDEVISDPACGNELYDVILSYTNDTINTTMETSYNFTGLIANTSYSVTVAGRNDAGVGDNDTGEIETVTMYDGIPETIGNVSINGRTASSINVTWDPAISRYCGGVSFYQVYISSLDHTDIMNNSFKIMANDMLEARFTNLKENTLYNISVTAVNRAGNGIPQNITNITLPDNCCGRDDCWPIPCVFIIIACILILILMIDCCLFYYIYKKVKSGSEPHPIIVITFVILTAGIGWVLYKHLTKTKGPSKIGMQDTEKTPSPDDEPVAYTTTETDKVTFGTSDSTDTKKKKQKKPEMVKKPAAEPANQGGLMYADLDIGKGPAAPGSIFPQEKTTYGQVKPSN